MKKIFLVLILLILPLAYAHEAEDIIYAGQLKTHLTIDSSFDIVKTKSNYKIDYVTVKLSYLPLETYRQRVVSYITTPKAQEAGDYLLFNWDNPPIGSETFKSDYIMISGSEFFPIKNKVFFPLKNLDKEYIIYTKPTDLIDINQDIRDLANEISQNEDDLYKIVFDAAIWVNQNIEYDLSTATAEASLSSSWVLENRRGVCDEMTNLFISILRSLGIPARFVSGISYTNSEDFIEPWGPHGWAEVYFPNQGWVPFDPTYGEYGFVDASHIKLKESVDSDKSSVDYEWLSYGVDIKGNIPKNTVDVIEHTGKIYSDLSISLSSLKEKVGFGSYNVYIAEIKNDVNEYRTVKLELVGTKDVDIKTKTKYVLLKPKETKKVVWKVLLPYNLEKNSIYTFPFTLYDNYGNDFDINTELASRYIYLDENTVNSYIKSIEVSDSVLDVKLECSMPNSPSINEKIVIACSVDKDGLSACLDNECKNIGRTFIFEKEFDSSGAYPILVIVKKDELQKSYFNQITVFDSPNINLTWSEFDNSINYSKSEKLSFVIERISLSKPLEMEIVLEYNGQSSKNTISNFEDSELIQFVIRGADLRRGNNEIKIFINYYDDKGEKYTKEYSQTINMQTSNFLEYILAKFNSFIFFLSGFF